jgi:hypothetical protein
MSAVRWWSQAALAGWLGVLEVFSCFNCPVPVLGFHQLDLKLLMRDQVVSSDCKLPMVLLRCCITQQSFICIEF